MIIQPEFNGGGIPLGEYPRPQFARDSYFPLNGRWEYAITSSKEEPERFEGEILVPYSPESPLSGVGRQLTADKFLHYRRTFTLPQGFNRGRVLLNIGACDQRCTVEVLSGSHKGLVMDGVNMLSGSLADDKVFKPGDIAWVLVERDGDDNPIFINMIDHYRLGKELIGALSASLATALVGHLMTSWLAIHGSVLEQSESLLYAGFQNLDLTSLFIGVVALSAGGAIMDLSIDVSVAMAEVKDHAPGISRLELVKSGIAVGRAGVGTQTTTLLLAYMGAWLSVMMVYMAQSTPTLNILTGKMIASEIVQTLTGCTGLVLVTPLTSLIAGWLYVPAGRDS